MTNLLMGLLCWKQQGNIYHLREEKALLQGSLQSYEREVKASQEFKKEVTNEFTVLADRIFQEKGKKIAETSHALLNPLREQINTFQKRIESVHERNIADNASLITKISEIQNLNQQLSSDAKQLTTALKGDSQSRGAWGEMVLEKILEESGLEKNREYELQNHFTDNENNSLRPDAIVRLPRDRDIIIDSKLTLLHYKESINQNDPDEQQICLKKHADALKNQIKILSGKYTKLPGLRNIECTLLFVPIEGALVEAFRIEPQLQEEAFSRNIILVAPSTLMVALKCMHYVWSTEKRERNLEKVVQEVSALLEKIANFSEDLQSVGGRLDQAKNSYDTAYSRLVSGNGSVIKKAKNIQKMGSFHTKKELPNTTDDD